MARKPLIRTSQFPYHVYNRVNNREWYPLDLQEVWKIFCEEWRIVAEQKDAQIHAFTLMSNHHHMILSTPRENIDEVIRDLSRSVVETINLKTGRSGRLFTSPHKKIIVDTAAYYSHVIKYVYRNPVKAGVVEHVEDYAFSTLAGLVGNVPLPFPIYRPPAAVDDVLIPENGEDLLRWLNTPFKSEHEEAVRAALKKSVFRIPAGVDARVRAELEKVRL